MGTHGRPLEVAPTPTRGSRSLTLTIKLGRMAMTLLFLLLEEFKTGVGAGQKQPEALA